MSRRGYVVAAVCIVLLAAVVRFWGLGVGLPHLAARPDDEAVLAMTGKPAMGEFDLGWAVYPSAWIYLNWLWGTAVQWFGEVLGFWWVAPYRNVLASRPERLLLAERVLTALLGTITVAAVIRLGRVSFGRTAGLVAGTLLAVNFVHARDAHSIKPDVALGLALVGCLAACRALERRGGVGRGALAGAAAGLAAACKYPGAVVGLSVWWSSVVASTARGWRRVVPAAAVAAAVAALAVFIGTSPFLVRSLDRIGTVVILAFPSLAPPQPTPPQPTPVVPPLEPLPRFSLPYHLFVSLPVAFGVLGALLLPAALVWGLATRRPPGRAAVVLVVVWLALIGLSPVRLVRYVTPLAPVLALLVGGAMASAARRLPLARTMRGVLVAAVTVAVAAEPLAAVVAHDRLASRTDTRVLATAWLEAHVPLTARVGVAGTVLWGYGEPAMPPGVVAVRVSTLDPAQLAALRVSWLLVHDHPLVFSHVDEAALARLGPQWRQVATFDPFVGPRERAWFEASDAYYLPLRGFDVVERPGPRIRIYQLVPPPK